MMTAAKINIREATLEDKQMWDSFIDSQDGSFRYYFEWKYVTEAGGNAPILLIIEREPSEIIGVFPLVKMRRKMYSALKCYAGAGGPLLKKTLPQEEKELAIKTAIQYLDEHYADGCSGCELVEMLPPGSEVTANPIQAILDCGYRLRYDESTGMPCNHLLELKTPFLENIWMGLWSANFRSYLRRAEKKIEENNIRIIEDKEMRYAETYAEMVIVNYKRHLAYPPKKEETLTELKVFKNKTKLFVAIKDDEVIYAICCHYSPTTCYIGEVGTFKKDIGGTNNYIWKIAIEDACNSGYRYVDFGVTMDTGVAVMKDRFKGVRIPVRTYEKRYSLMKSIIELTPLFVGRLFRDTGYLWYHRRRIWDRIIHW